FDEIEPVYLSPADAAAAFASDKIDAWTVWDPFFAIAETRYQPRVLARSSDVLDVNTYFIANKGFAAEHPDAITTTVQALDVAAKWADANRDKVAAALHEVTGVPLEAQTLAANRTVFGIFPITQEIVANQQATADRFFRLGLIPKEVKIGEAVWTPPAN
ncbi:ABC transporter substrate-binding protein, partial [Rhizobiaceae sp. 2RAB30]